MVSEKLQGVLFGRFLKVSQEERTIKSKNEGEEDSKYYVVYLSDGVKTFDVTCGVNNVVLTLPPFQWADFGFDIQDRKVKVVSAVLYPMDKLKALEAMEAEKEKNAKKTAEAEAKANAEAEAAVNAAAEAKAEALDAKTKQQSKK